MGKVICRSSKSTFGAKKVMSCVNLGGKRDSTWSKTNQLAIFPMLGYVEMRDGVIQKYRNPVKFSLWKSTPLTAEGAEQGSPLCSDSRTVPRISKDPSLQWSWSTTSVSGIWTRTKLMLSMLTACASKFTQSGSGAFFFCKRFSQEFPYSLVSRIILPDIHGLLLVALAS